MSAYSGRVYRAEVLVSRPDQGRTPDDLLAEALTALSQSAMDGNAKRYRDGMVSIVVRLLAYSDTGAITAARMVQSAVSGPADVTSITTGRGRSHRRVSY
jgi:hypothetical protein